MLYQKNSSNVRRSVRRISQYGPGSDGTRRWFAAAVAASTLLLAAPAVEAAAAETRIGINGGRPSEWSFLAPALADQGLTQQGWLDFASRVGENWLPNATSTIPLVYPAQLGLISGPNALSGDRSTAIGQVALNEEITRQLGLAPDVPVVVAGLSEGTLVIDRELDYLAANPDGAPGRNQLSFVVFGDMRRGLGQMYFPGVSVPIFGYTFTPVTDSQYDVSVVIEQWDGWANPPDRPWNLLADLNAAMGAVYTVNGSNDHSSTSLDAMSEAVVVSSVKSSLGGTTTTYMIPKTDLPLTRPLRQIGVPSWAVNDLNKLLMPIIQSGYSAMTPKLGPRIESGKLVFTPPPADVVEAMKPIKAADYGAPLPATAPTSSGAAVTSPAADVTARSTGEADTGEAGGSSSDEHGSRSAHQLRQKHFRTVKELVGPDEEPADTAVEDGPTKIGRKPGGTLRPRPGHLRANNGPSEASKPEQERTDTTDANQSAKDVTKSAVGQPLRSVRVREAQDSTNSAGAPRHAKPKGAGGGGNEDASHTASASASA